MDIFWIPYPEKRDYTHYPVNVDKNILTFAHKGNLNMFKKEGIVEI